MILHKVNLVYTKHCAVPFGSYVQPFDDPPSAKKNTLAPRAIDGLYLRYMDCVQGGHQILDLRTHQVITRQRVQIIPITTSVVHLVQELAKQDKMPDGLKIATKTGSIIYDSTLIAGVDYNPQNVHYPNHDVQNSDDDDSSDDETYTQSTETTVDSEDDLDYRSETSAPQGENDNQPELEAYDEEDEEEAQIEDDNQSGIATITTRSGRTVTPPERLNLHQQQIEEAPYTRQSGRIIANVMHEFNAMQTCGNLQRHHSYAETFSLKAGLKKFGTRGHQAAAGEIKQLHDRAVFKPIDVNTLSQGERKRQCAASFS
jgi:hypothetical protein